MSYEDISRDDRLNYYSRNELDKSGFLVNLNLNLRSISFEQPNQKWSLTAELEMHTRKGCVDKNECLEGDFGGEQICNPYVLLNLI